MSRQPDAGGIGLTLRARPLRAGWLQADLDATVDMSGRQYISPFRICSRSFAVKGLAGHRFVDECRDDPDDGAHFALLAERSARALGLDDDS
jgi:hypothetical protein